MEKCIEIIIIGKNASKQRAFRQKSWKKKKCTWIVSKLIWFLMKSLSRRHFNMFTWVFWTAAKNGSRYDLSIVWQRYHIQFTKSLQRPFTSNTIFILIKTIGFRLLIRILESVCGTDCCWMYLAFLWTCVCVCGGKPCCCRRSIGLMHRYRLHLWPGEQNNKMHRCARNKSATE